MNISNAEGGRATSREREMVRNPERSEVKLRNRQLEAAKQYSWMYIPEEEFQLVFGKLKAENLKLKQTLEELNRDHSKRML